MVERKSYMPSFSRRKLVSVTQESSSQTTHLLLGFNEIEVPLRIYGKRVWGYKQQCNS